MDYQTLADLPKEKLLELCELYAKNWIALDGFWFQGVEQTHGFAEALRLDGVAWQGFTVAEAKRLKAFLALGEEPGLAGLRQALQFRLWAPLKQHTSYFEGEYLYHRIVDCRVQVARRRKNLPYHTCKPVGLLEYSLFAAAIDPRIETECLSCHPDIREPDCDCCWRFSLRKD